MTKYNWNYQEMGFNSESEMNASIKRAEHKLNLSRSELVREEMQEGFARARKEFSIAEMEEGARLEGLDQKVLSRISDERQQAKLQAKQEESQRLMNAFSEHIQSENEAKAQKELQKEKEKLEAELQKEIYSRHNVKTDKQKERDEALSSLLDSLNV